MSDRGFLIQEHCAVRAITLNRPKEKESNQFDERQVAKSFDIAATGIHVKRFMGMVTEEYQIPFCE